MIITLSPVAGLPGQPETEIVASGDRITVDGLSWDFSALPEGEEIVPQGEHPFLGPVRREGGDIRCMLCCLYSPGTAAPNQPSNPAHWTVSLGDGPVVPAIIRRPETEA